MQACDGSAGSSITESQERRMPHEMSEGHLPSPDSMTQEADLPSKHAACPPPVDEHETLHEISTTAAAQQGDGGHEGKYGDSSAATPDGTLPIPTCLLPLTSVIESAENEPQNPVPASDDASTTTGSCPQAGPLRERSISLADFGTLASNRPSRIRVLPKRYREYEPLVQKTYGKSSQKARDRAPAQNKRKRSHTSDDAADQFHGEPSPRKTKTTSTVRTADAAVPKPKNKRTARSSGTAIQKSKNKRIARTSNSNIFVATPSTSSSVHSSLQKPSRIVVLKIPRRAPTSAHALALPTPPSEADASSKSSLVSAHSAAPEVPQSTDPELHAALPLPAASLTTSTTPPEPDCDRLLSISQQLTRKLPIDQKPLPRGKPEFFSSERYSLCETLPGLYNSYQGSYYSKDNHATSFMLDGFGHSRDIITKHVIVLSGSGGKTSEKTGDKYIQTKDHEDSNAQAMAMRRAIRDQEPLAVLFGQKNGDVPTKMPHAYNAGDWYKVTDGWTELDGRPGGVSGRSVKVQKWRLERMAAEDDPWFVPADFEDPVKPAELGPPIVRQCTTCSEWCNQIYLASWMCTNASCAAHWKLPNGEAPDQFVYDPRFLMKVTPWDMEQRPCSMRPDPPPMPKDQIVSEAFRNAFSKGIVCECGHCTPRLHWTGWQCPNCDKFTEHLPMTVPPEALYNPLHCVGYGPAPSHDKIFALGEVNRTRLFRNNYRWESFTIRGLPGCKITHAIANKKVREEPGGPNDLFVALQERAREGTLPLERRRLSTGKGMLMQSFMSNFGFPYNFVARGDSIPFNAAPAEIRRARTRLNWAGAMAANAFAPGTQRPEDDRVNEVLVVGYFEALKMGFHDDGETGLGDTIVTLSLGWEAEMLFRPKGLYYWGVSGRGVYMDTDADLRARFRHPNEAREKKALPPLPGFYKYEERVRALEELRKCGTQDEYVQKLRDIPKELGLPSSKEAPVWLKLKLCHGDFVVMKGRALQQYFEHMVKSTGRLRFALTGRHVQASHLAPDQIPEAEEPDDGFYDGSAITC